MATITYSGPSQFLTSQTWREVQPSLLSQSPLRNIHWKSASRTALRTIQQLDLTFVPLDILRDEHTSQVPTTLLDKPLLHLYIFACEETDPDTYRTTFKKLIKEWHASVTTKRNRDWMVIQVVRSDVRAQSGKLFQLKGSVSDKLKADFNSDKRDRCSQLNWSSGSQTPVAWADFTNKLKDGLLYAFDSAVTQREEEVKRSEGQRSMPGWNFCTFFILKESLATSFKSVGLFNDALLQYDELEASFFRVMKDKNMSWFGALIDPTAEDPSSPLLSITKKPYRDLILANTISIFDFRIYLLARQCEILAQTSSINEICRKCAAFLSAFGRRLREGETSLPLFFIEYWRYSAALSVVDQCEAWASMYSPVKREIQHPEAGKGELLELARSQLDIIGVKLGHLPTAPPFLNLISAADPSPNAPPSADIAQSKSADVSFMDSIIEPERFYVLYTDTTNRAIELYAQGGRKKFALKLHGSLAALDRHRGRLPIALSTFSSLPAHYHLHLWTSLELFMYSKAIETHDTLDKEKDREWLMTLLSFLQTFVSSSDTEILTLSEDMNSHLSSLISTLSVTAARLDSELSFPDHPMISLLPSKEASLADSQDGSRLDVTVHNRLPSNIPIDRVCVNLLGQNSEHLEYSAKVDFLPPGNSQMTLSCLIPVSGPYIFESSEVHMSKVILQWLHWKPANFQKSRKHGKGNPVVISVPHDPLAFDVSLRPPQTVELDRAPTIVVSVRSGRNTIQHATAKLSAPGLTFHPTKALVLEGSTGTLDGTRDQVVLKDIPPYQHLSFSIPLSDSTSSQIKKVVIEIEYTTAEESNLSRSFRVNRTIDTSPPITTSVEDFFHGDKLFSRFTVSTTSHQYVRISQAELRPPDGVNIDVTSCSPPRRIFSVTPTQPAVFLFLVQSDVRSLEESLHLRVTFRMLREEIEHHVQSAVEKVLGPQSRQRLVLTRQIIAILEKESDWVNPYISTGKLQLPTLPDETFQDDIKAIEEELQHPALPSSGPWREMIFPVDVPSRNIVLAANIEIIRNSRSMQDPSMQVYAGEPISAKLTVHASFHWGPSGRNDIKYKVRFDVQEMVNDWLVSGRKRGDIVVSEGPTFTAMFTLVALHHGLLSLPRVTFIPLPTGESVGRMNSAIIPTLFEHQLHAAEKILVHPRAGRTTFMVDTGY